MRPTHVARGTVCNIVGRDIVGWYGMFVNYAEQCDGPTVATED